MDHPSTPPNLNDPEMYEPVAESLKVTSQGKKRKRGPDSQTENVPSAKKCRAVYGVAQRELWCKMCKRRHKCSRFID